MDGQLPDDELEALAAVPPAQAQPPPPVVAPPPVAAPVQVAPPPMVPPGTHAVKGTRTVEGLQPSADLQAGHAAEQKVFADERKLAGDEAATQGEAARIQAEQAQQVADETARRNAEIQAEQQHQADQQEIRNNKWLADLEAIKASKAPGGFETWPQEKKVRGYLAVALAGLARGSTGGTNIALAQINKQVEDQRKAWTQDQELRFKALEATHGFNAQLDQQARDTIAQGYARKAMALDSLNRQADAQLKALGIPAAQQAGMKAQLGLDKAAADAQMKYGQIVSTKTTDATHFAPGAAGAVGGGGQGGVVDLVTMAENGAKRSEIVAKAAKMGLPEKVWKNQVDLAFSEREKGLQRTDQAEAKRVEENEKRAVRSSDGTVVGYAGGARPDVQGIQKQNIAFESAEDFLKTLLRNHDHVPAGSDWHNGVLAIATTTTANPSDKTTEHEEGTLKSALGLIDRDAVKVKLKDVQRRRQAFLKGLRPVEGGEPSADAPVAAGKAAGGAQGGGKRPSPVDAAIDAQAARYGL